MKKFLIYILIFFGIVVCIDFIFGLACGYFNANAKGGDTANHYYITNTQTEPVIIMGSSRAIHHYVPEILEDSLGKGVYNCGLDGNGILFQYGRLALLLERYKPEVLIYDVMPLFDISSPDLERDLGWLRRWYGHEVLDSIFNDIEPSENWKMKSNLYRYNGSFIQMVTDYIHPFQTVSYKGYKPVEGVIDYVPEYREQKINEWHPIKLKYFKKLINICKENGIHLIVAYSPQVGKKSSAEYTRLTELCKTNDIPVIDYYGGSCFNDFLSFFKDASHLNDKGAREYTRSFVSKLRPLIEK